MAAIELTDPQLTVIEDAITAWMVRTSGLGEAHVIWRDQAGPPPSTPYIDLKFIGGPTEIGHDWKTYERDVLDEVVTERVEGPRLMRLQVQLFADDVTELVAARGLLGRVMAARSLSSVQQTLSNAHCAIGFVDVVRSQSASGTFGPRAICEMNIHVASSISEVADEIKFVNVNLIASDGVDDILDEQIWVPTEPPP